MVEQAQKARFARSGMADQEDERALFDVEIDVVESANTIGVSQGNATKRNQITHLAKS